MFNRSLLRPLDLTEVSKFSNSNAKKFCLTARNATKVAPAELCVFEEVGDYGATGITAKDVASFLADNKGKAVNVKINSPGGLVFDGLTIYNALISHEGLVTTTVVGIAASIASIILMAGNKRIAYESSSLMCHRALAICIGNEADMEDCRTWLKKMDDQLAGIYSARSGQPKAKMLGLMVGDVDGTYFSAEEALKLRLIDEVIPNSGNARNSNPRAPSDVGDRIRQISDHERREQMRAAARRRVRELQTV